MLQLVAVQKIFTSPLVATPGNAALWTHSSIEDDRNKYSMQSGKTEYVSKSMTTSKFIQQIDSESSNNEVFVFLTSLNDENPLKHAAVIDSVKGSSRAIIMPSVYFEGSDGSIDELKKLSEAFKGARKMSLEDFHDHVSKSQNIFSNGVVDSFEVNLSGDISQDKVQLNDIVNNARNKRSSVLFATISEPSRLAMLPAVDGEYHRVLGVVNTNNTSSSSSNTTYAPSNSSTGIFYKPEGAEYSIYYADTYLYITPDIFTGLMTMLFMIFVLYMGLSCLNAVQGCSSFVSKPIPLGKEF